MENQNEKVQSPEIKNTTNELLARSAALKKKNHETLDKLHALKDEVETVLKSSPSISSKP